MSYVYPVESHSLNLLIPKRLCFFGMYCLKTILPLNFTYLLRRQPTRWCRTCSIRNLDLYAICLEEEGSAAVVELLGMYVLPISYITRNAYSSPYWLFYRFQRHPTLLSHLLQRYKHEERISNVYSTSRWQLYHVRASSTIRMVTILMMI